MTGMIELLNRLPFVRWDRCVRPGDWLLVYGWIDRDDGRSDFVLVEFYEGDLRGVTSSSAKYSEQITELLFGSTGSGHRDCERVSDVLPGVQRTTAQTDMMPTREVMEATLGLRGEPEARRDAA